MKNFEDELMELIQEYLDSGFTLDEIISVMELRLMALEELYDDDEV